MNIKNTSLAILLFSLFTGISFAGEIYSGKAAIKLLQQSGYVIYLRHAATNHEQDDVFPVDLSDCDTQRNLSETGVKQAKVINNSLKRNSIKIGKVVSSPFCRCVDTAKYSAGEPVIDDNLYFAVGIDKTKREKQSENLRSLLAEQPEKGTNTLIVSHTANLKEAVGIWPKPEGVATFSSRTGGLEGLKRGCS